MAGHLCQSTLAMLNFLKKIQDLKITTNNEEHLNQTSSQLPGVAAAAEYLGH